MITSTAPYPEKLDVSRRQKIFACEYNESSYLPSIDGYYNMDVDGYMIIVGLNGQIDCVNLSKCVKR